MICEVEDFLFEYDADELAEPQGREVRVLRASVDGSGKSTLGQYLCHRYGGQYVGRMPAENDFAHNYKEHSRLVVIDIARKDKHCCFKTIERIKTGHLSSSKYQGRTLVLRPPMVIITSNFDLPPHIALSADRINQSNVHEVNGDWIM